MKKLVAIPSMVLLAALSLPAQGRGRGHAGGGGQMPVTTPGAVHSNAPAGNPAASSDRDKGLERAKDVGQGQKQGLQKKHKNKKSRKNKKNASRAGNTKN